MAALFAGVANARTEEAIQTLNATERIFLLDFTWRVESAPSRKTRRDWVNDSPMWAILASTESLIGMHCARHRPPASSTSSRRSSTLHSGKQHDRMVGRSNIADRWIAGQVGSLARAMSSAVNTEQFGSFARRLSGFRGRIPYVSPPH